MKRVLITGANSYIGMSFESYVTKHYKEDLEVTTIDMIDGAWRSQSFEQFDIVFHVAGLAHADVGTVSEDVKRKYYLVNTDLAIETAKKAKESGVKQFVFMSSSIIYGESAPYGKRKVITADTEPNPSNFYGDSKWQADKGVRELMEDGFNVVVLRPPMIYGKNSKGNYPVLSKIARKMSFFPDIKNERSMLYIDNLCEFLVQVMIRNLNGIFWPQNDEYSETSELVKKIAEINGRKIFVSKIFNIGIIVASMFPGKIGKLTNKAFGNMTYEKKMSKYEFDYVVCDLEESIRRTEG